MARRAPSGPKAFKLAVGLPSTPCRPADGIGVYVVFLPFTQTWRYRLLLWIHTGCACDLGGCTIGWRLVRVVLVSFALEATRGGRFKAAIRSRFVERAENDAKPTFAVVN